MESSIAGLGNFSARVGVVCAAVCLVGALGYSIYSVSESGVSDGVCNVAVIPIRGEIDAFGYQYEDGTVYTLGDDVIAQVHFAEQDPRIQGIVVTVDSYGGHGGPSFAMMEALRDSTLPVVAYIREVGTSGAYLAATGADFIVASPYAEVGSIGATYSYTENSKKNEEEGITFVQLSSGDYKDLGNPNKPLTQGEREILERNLADVKRQFVWDVATNRGMATSAVEAIADGSFFSSATALRLGLVDSMGGIDDVRSWMAAMLETDIENVMLCQ